MEHQWNPAVKGALARSEDDNGRPVLGRDHCAVGLTEFDEGADYERWANSLGHYVDIPGVGLAFVPASRDEHSYEALLHETAAIERAASSPADDRACGLRKDP